MLEIPGKPVAFKLYPGRTALVMIDMQRDFLLKDGYGYLQCNSDKIFNEVSQVIGPCQKALQAARTLGMTIIHTREGHEPDLRDLASSKLLRQSYAKPDNYPFLIGDEGPLGKLLVRGSWGHDIIDELKPLQNEVVLDKPGKGSFYNTDLHQILVTRGITHLLIGGVTTECCVATTFREANDHGFDCCVLADCTSGFNKAIYDQTINTFCSYDGLLGSISTGLELVRLAKYNDLGLKSVDPNLMSIDWIHENYRHGETPQSLLKTLKHKHSSLKLNDFFDIPDIVAQSMDDHSPLYGIPFIVHPSIGRDAKVVEILVKQGAMLVGITSDVDSFINNDLATFALTVDSGEVETTLYSFTPSTGMVPLTGTRSSLLSSVCIISKSFQVVRTIFASTRSYDEEDPTSKQYFEFPVKPVDYRPMNESEVKVSFASNSIETRLEDLKVTECEFDQKFLDEVLNLRVQLRFFSIDTNVIKLQKKYKALLMKSESPEVIITSRNPEYRQIARTLGVPYAEVKQVGVIGDFGQDGRFLDILEYFNSK